MKNKRKKTAKRHVISTRISCDELQRLEMKARSCNMSISDLMREALQALVPHETGYINS